MCSEVEFKLEADKEYCRRIAAIKYEPIEVPQSILDMTDEQYQEIISKQNKNVTDY